MYLRNLAVRIYTFSETMPGTCACTNRNCQNTTRFLQLQSSLLSACLELDLTRPRVVHNYVVYTRLLPAIQFHRCDCVGHTTCFCCSASGMAGVRCRNSANLLLSAPRACVHGRFLPRRCHQGRHVHLRDRLRSNDRPVAVQVRRPTVQSPS